MKKLILPFATFLSLNSYALTQISYCWNGDCFQNGWTEYSDYASLDYACRANDCYSMGQINGTFNAGTYTMCLDNDCLHNGYYEIKRSNQELIAKTICNGGDCSQFGSTIYSKDGIKELKCIDQNCFRSGHQIIQNSKIIEITYCLENDCEHIGWKTIK